MSRSHQSTTSSSSLVTAYSAEDTFLQSSSGYEPMRGPPPDHVTLQAQTQSQPQPTRPAMNSNSNTHSTTGSRISSAWSQFGATVSGVSGASSASNARPDPRTTETIDFMDTYVNVCETDADEVDIILAGGDPGIANINNPAADQEQGLRGDILTILLSGPLQLHSDQEDGVDGESIVTQCEDANRATARAAQAKKDGNLQEALDAHTQAAKLFREAAIHIGDGNGTLCYVTLYYMLVYVLSRFLLCTCNLLTLLTFPNCDIQLLWSNHCCCSVKHRRNLHWRSNASSSCGPTACCRSRTTSRRPGAAVAPRHTRRD